jgi:hypothetical protein
MAAQPQQVDQRAFTQPMFIPKDGVSSGAGSVDYSAHIFTVNPQKLTLANELLLEIFPLLSVKGLIKAQGVSRLWRRLVPLSHLLPTRRALLDLYITTINSPAFLITRPRLSDNLWDFDRREYISQLTQGEYVLPDEFCLWILEMPARATIRWIWPTLDSDHNVMAGWRRRGINALSQSYEDLGVMEMNFVKQLSDNIVGLFENRTRSLLVLEIWSDVDITSYYLAIGDEFPGVKGQVYPCKGHDLYQSYCSYTWVGWLKEELKCMEKEVEKELRQFRELRELPNVSIFPNDVLLDIFDWLPIGSVVACERVCRDWHYFVALARRLLYLDPKYPNVTIRHHPKHQTMRSLFGTWRTRPEWLFVSSGLHSTDVWCR